MHENLRLRLINCKHQLVAHYNIMLIKNVDLLIKSEQILISKSVTDFFLPANSKQ